MGLGRALSVLVFEWVTGGGLAEGDPPPSWSAEGRAMRSAIAADFAGVRHHGEPIRVVAPLDARLSEDRGPWESPRVGPGELEHRLVEFSAAVDCIVLIAPETNGVLAELTGALDRGPARLMGSTRDAVEAVTDKARLAVILESRGIPTPATRRIDPRRPFPREAHYPAVLKPVDGAGSLDTFLLPGPDNRPSIPDSMDQAILQPWIPGQPMSASFLVNPNGQSSLMAMGRQRMVIEGGRFIYLGGELPTPIPEPLPILTRALDAVPGLGGFVGIDFLWNAERKQATILEINPRPTTSCVGLARVLPRGFLAEAWLGMMGISGEWPIKIDRFSEIVRGARPIAFGADGSIKERGGLA